MATIVGRRCARRKGAGGYTRRPMTDRLFTPRFFVMCAFSFTVFVSVFCLLPTMPFRILELGGTKAAAGLFLGFLTYASAFSAPVTGALADRLGKRRVLIACSLAIAGFSVAYAFSTRYQWMLGLAFFHGVFWSGLLSASAAYMTDMIPESRRAEGIGYWGLSTIAAVAVAPTLGLWLYAQSWRAMCLTTTALDLVMAGIAFSLHEARSPAARGGERFFHLGMLEWRVAVVSFTLFLYSFAYGGITSFSALYAQANGTTPRSLYLIALAAVILLSRPLLVPRAERLGHRRVFLYCLVLIVVGLALLAVGGTRGWLIASAVVFGVGFGIAYPVYVAYVMRHVHPLRRGAAFGGILAAFDTGIGTGSIAVGWLVEHHGFRVAFGAAAVLAALSLPYFLFVDRRLLQPATGGP
jgi:MFS family permease